MGSGRARWTALALVASALVAVPARAAITTCSMGGPTPGYRVIRFDLPNGTDFLGIEPRGTRASRPVSDSSNWHLAQGIFIVNAATLELEAYRVESAGSAPRAVVARPDGTDVVSQPIAVPDGPFYHTVYRTRAGLPAGSYYAIGFGSDGGPALPNEWWAVDVRIAGTHGCASAGTGETFDFDNTEFTGGTQTYAMAAGVAEGVQHAFTTPREIVVGLMDAAVQGPGEAELDYAMPGDVAGTVSDEIVPFVSVGGTHSFTGRFRGAYPMLLVAGVAVDVA